MWSLYIYVNYSGKAYQKAELEEGFNIANLKIAVRENDDRNKGIEICTSYKNTKGEYVSQEGLFPDWLSWYV